MFSFFKRWRSGDKNKTEDKAQQEQVVEQQAHEKVVSEEGIKTPNSFLSSEKLESKVELKEEDSQAVEVVPNPVEIPAPTVVPEPAVPTVSNLPDLPAPGSDGKVRIKINLNDFAPPISDEELEAAALAEIPEDSPLRYQTESEEIAAVLEADDPAHDENEEPENIVTHSNDIKEMTMNSSLESEKVPHEKGDITSALEESETLSSKTVATVTEVHSDENGEETVHSATPVSEKQSWLSRLKKSLSRTGSGISALFVGVKVDEDLFEELETALIMADAGVEATQSLLSKLRTKVKKERIEDAAEVKKALHGLLTEHLKPLEKRFVLDQDITNVVMIAGVNGAGKTTSIGKLAHHFQASGASVLLAAGDTFRAAAREQLIEWGSRNNVQVIAQDGGDPAAVAFDAVNAGRARKTNVVMVDTAGRLPTQTHLMEELKKIKRVIGKADNTAPHEILLVVDGNTGQNAIAQIRAFDAVLGLTGLVVTKLDGTAKGGTLAAVAAGSQGVRPIPVYWIGVGESLHDLQPFVASEFASALLGE
ncbi:signal recognition particle-docking protein FtsY [Pelistega europaea]|uniref:Signal recognition particle receptor FtsY n=1 Tax=Pelistega europaea TaxID=106147 RepID=A0A7Y4LBF7_9BURK|nr:signal recognition particle-docking protein FtsY [Pelistega europaea]NOL50479.1 signal recognition particle-docking protein FtsY [Pelistega europaea]